MTALFTKSLSINISRGQLGGAAAVPEGQGKSQFASRIDTLVSQAGEDYICCKTRTISRREQVKLLPQRLPLLSRGEKSHKEGQKESSTPTKKRGRGKRLKEPWIPHPMPTLLVRGTRKRNTIYALAKGKKESLPQIIRAFKKIQKQKWPQSHSAFTRDSTKGGMTEVSTHPR